MASGPGVLYVVATPIGNLEDLTFRALRILKEVDLIAAEDTRRTSGLLAHYQIRQRLVSVREHNEARESPRLVRQLQGGRRIALVSDAGTPAIADPGARLVQAARAAGISVIAIPGPSAITAALSVSGLNTSEFSFLGFPPASGSIRHAWFDRLPTIKHAIVFFEAPHRVARTLADLANILVNRPIYLNREMTKINEECVVRPINGQSSFDIRSQGELTIVVAPESGEPCENVGESTLDLIGRLIESGLFQAEEATSIAAARDALPNKVVKKAWKKYLLLVKRQRQSAT